MKAAGTLRGRIVGADGAGRQADLTLELVDREARMFDSFSERSKPDGTFFLKGVSPGRYTLFVEGEKSEVGLLSDLELGSGTILEGLVVPLERGAELQVSLAGERELATALLRARGRTLRRFPVSKKAPQTLTLPPDDYVVQLLDEGGAPIAEELVQLAVGAKRAVTLAPPEDG
jgi:hypothetical protein